MFVWGINGMAAASPWQQQELLEDEGGEPVATGAALKGPPGRDRRSSWAVADDELPAADRQAPTE